MTFAKFFTMVATISVMILLFTASISASHYVSSSVNHKPPSRSVTSWLLESSNSSAQPLLSRNTRSTPWEWSIDALKCTLKILSVQVSHYHNNQLMCCGLWRMKAYLKKSAQDVCEKPEQTNAVFDDMIKEDVIYSSFAKSLLGDQTLDCAAYPEDSAACDQLFNFIIVILILIFLTLIAIIVGFIVALVFCFYYRQKYNDLTLGPSEKKYKKAGSESDLSDSSSLDNNNRTQKPKKSYIDNFKRSLLGPPRNERPLVNFNSGAHIKDKPSAPSLVANGLSGANTPERCSSSASTNSSTVPSQKEDHQV